MIKTAKPSRSSQTPRRTRSAAAPSPAARRALPAATLVEGRVRAVDERGLVRGALAGGEAIEALCPAHIDRAWLREASARGPVEAAFAIVRPSGRYVLWGIFPGAVHADVRADIVVRGRNVRVDAESLQLSSRAAQLKLDPDGNVALRGRDVTSHARRVNRIKGGAIRLN